MSSGPQFFKISWSAGDIGSVVAPVVVVEVEAVASGNGSTPKPISYRSTVTGTAYRAYS